MRVQKKEKRKKKNGGGNQRRCIEGLTGGEDEGGRIDVSLVAISRTRLRRVEGLAEHPSGWNESQHICMHIIVEIWS